METKKVKTTGGWLVCDGYLSSIRIYQVPKVDMISLSFSCKSIFSRFSRDLLSMWYEIAPTSYMPSSLSSHSLSIESVTIPISDVESSEMLDCPILSSKYQPFALVYQSSLPQSNPAKYEIETNDF